MHRQYLTNFDTRPLPQEEWEYVVIGSGIAGLYTAYIASRGGGKAVVLTKHYRLDFPAPSERWRRHIIFKRG